MFSEASYVFHDERDLRENKSEILNLFQPADIKRIGRARAKHPDTLTPAHSTAKGRRRWFLLRGTPRQTRRSREGCALGLCGTNRTQQSLEPRRQPKAAAVSYRNC